MDEDERLEWEAGLIRSAREIILDENGKPKVLPEAGIDAPKFRGVYLGRNGEERPCYFLPRRECDLADDGNGIVCTLTLGGAQNMLTGKRHDNVIRTIEKVLPEHGIDAPKFGGIYLDVQNNVMRYIGSILAEVGNRCQQICCHLL